MISLEGKLLLPTVALMMHHQKMPQISKVFGNSVCWALLKKSEERVYCKNRIQTKNFRSLALAFFFSFTRSFLL